MNFDQRALQLHKKYRGKFAVHSLMPLATKTDLSVAYTPGVAAVSRLIGKKRSAARTHSMKGRTIAIISDGSAILGLGNLGPEAALPVMEGKAILFKHFANVDAVPIVLATQDTEEIISAITSLAPTFGGINLEDISAPRCFAIERRLIDNLDIPVFHDDQHGTAIVVLAALTNALRIVRKQLPDARIVINGAGAAATAIAGLLMAAGARGRNILMVDRTGIIYHGRPGLNSEKSLLAQRTNISRKRGGLSEALQGTDVFIGTSVANVLTPDMVATMANRPIVFAMANPNPEIDPRLVPQTTIAVFGTGRSDLPNQINNVLAFPGIFRGALDAGARRFTTRMKIAAALAISASVSTTQRQRGIIVPDPFNPRVHQAVARAVARLA